MPVSPEFARKWQFKRFGDFSLMWFLGTAYLESDRRNSHTCRNERSGPE